MPRNEGSKTSLLFEEVLSVTQPCEMPLTIRIPTDPPRGQEEWIPSDPRFTHAIDLVRHIRKGYGDYFCIGVAGAVPSIHRKHLPVQLSSTQLTRTVILTI